MPERSRDHTARRYVLEVCNVHISTSQALAREARATQERMKSAEFRDAYGDVAASHEQTAELWETLRKDWAGKEFG